MQPIAVGAVAYDPKAVTIWESIRDLFRERPIPIDYVLFSNYEALVEALFAKQIEIAWNTPVAWVKAKVRGGVHPLAMRDTDRNFKSVLIAKSGAGFSAPADLSGKRVALGSRDSGQAAILPLHYLEQAGARGVSWRRFDIDVGKHGDTGTSELEVVRAVAKGEADAGAIGDATWAKLLAEGAADARLLRALWTSPAYSHCNFTALESFSPDRASSFRDGLFAMSYSDPRTRRMMDLEGLKRWIPCDGSGYDDLEVAMRAQGMI